MAEQTQLRMTVREYFELPETNTPVELIDGELIVSPATSDNHQKTSGGFYLSLAPRLSHGELRYAPVDVVLDDGTIVQPDLLWVSPDNERCRLGENGRWYGAPDLVIEIFSPGTERRDRGVKFVLYQQHGVREYWMVDIEAQYIEIYFREGEQWIRLGIFGPGEPFASPLLGEPPLDVSSLLGLLNP